MNRGGCRDWVVVTLMAIAGVFLLAQLDNGYLWQDEAETALLARNTLRFGYPRAFDGRNYIEEPTHGYGPGEAWIYSPWLPFYLLAGVFAIIGASTSAARLPFALFGWLSVYLTWRLARRLGVSRAVQRLSVALLTCSVPFLLHMRQCRYYSLTTALVLGVCLAYLWFLKSPTIKRSVVLTVLLILLFHANFGTLVPLVGTLLIHQLGWGDPAGRRRLVIVASIVAALTLPWVVWFYRSAFIGAFSIGRAARHLVYYIRVTNKYLVPLAFMVVSSGLLLAWVKVTRGSCRGALPSWAPPPGVDPPTRGASPRHPREVARISIFFLLVVVLQLIFLAIPDQRHLRYLMPLLPILVIGEAWWLVAWLRRSRPMGWALIGLALLTNVLQAAHPRVPLADFLYELTHPYTGPMEGVVSYLREHGQPNQVVKIPYDDRTVMFYTQMKVERPSEFLRESDPDWIVLRRGWTPQAFLGSAYFHRIDATYERIELDAPDVYWQNREDPGEHHFRTVHDAPRVVIYKKRAPS